MQPSSNPASTSGWAAMFLLALIGASATVNAQEATEATAPQPARFGQLLSDAPVRCWPTDHSPVYVDALKTGDAVRITGEGDGYYTIALPLGATGYVHKKYATTPDDEGMVKAKGKSVSFRYRPRSTEAPVSTLADGTTLHFMGEDDEWYLVRNPAAVGHVPVAAVSVPEDQSALTVAFATMEATRTAEWKKVTETRVAAAKAAQELEANRTALQGLTARFRGEAGKPWQEQSKAEFAAIEAEVATLAPKFASGTTEATAAKTLEQEIKKQVVVLEAQAVAAESLPKAKVEPVVRNTTPDPITRFDLVGWLRVVSSSVPSRAVRIVRGGKVLGYLTCSSERYDLALFDGAEVGVIGPKEATSDGAWLIDVQRLEVLSVNLR